MPRKLAWEMQNYELIRQNRKSCRVIVSQLVDNIHASLNSYFITVDTA